MMAHLMGCCSMRTLITVRVLIQFNKAFLSLKMTQQAGAYMEHTV